MPLYRLDLEYHGAAYRGWQSQKNAETVADRLAAACKAALGEARELTAAGRTDAGVHALHQVCTLQAPARPERQALMAINDALPPDIAVQSLCRAAEGFHARHSAVERVYLYQVMRRRSAFCRQESFWVRDRLDLKAMQAAAALFCGSHDFAAFCEQDPGKPAPTRAALKSLELAEAGPLLLLRFRARHFLWKMVRRITGSLLEVGRGKAQLQDLAASLAKPDRRWAAFTAPPQGLFLERVLYAGEAFDQPLKPAFPPSPERSRHAQDQ
jgi:tRNA pseudouridine38-40 synthase